MFPTKPSGSRIPLPKSPAPSSKLPKVFNESSKDVSSTALPSSHSGDDTSELSGLYQLLSSRDVVKSGRQASYYPTPSITSPRRHGVYSRHQDLATMLAELAGSNNHRLSPSAATRNFRPSSTAWMGWTQGKGL